MNAGEGSLFHRHHKQPPSSGGGGGQSSSLAMDAVELAKTTKQALTNLYKRKIQAQPAVNETRTARAPVIDVEAVSLDGGVQVTVALQTMLPATQLWSLQELQQELPSHAQLHIPGGTCVIIYPKHVQKSLSRAQKLCLLFFFCLAFGVLAVTWFFRSK